MPVLGIGTDIVRTARFAEILAKHPLRQARLQDRILHPLERVSSADTSVLVRKLASSWAAKEALYKSLSPHEQKLCRFNQWRRAWGEHGYEMVSDSHRKDQVLISLSHDGEYTTAFAIRQTRK